MIMMTNRSEDIAERRWFLRQHDRYFLKKLIFFALFTGTAAEKYLAGENITLPCAVDESLDDSDRLRLIYQWEKQVGELKDKLIFYGVSNAAGGSRSVEVSNPPLNGRAHFTPPLLYIQNLNVNDSGLYMCKSTHSIDGRETTTMLEIEVNAVPDVSVVPVKNPVVNVDTQLYEASICRAIGGKPPARIRWIDPVTEQAQDSVESTVVSTDGSSNVTSVLRLRPGLIGRLANSTAPVLDEEKIGRFTCVVDHEWFPTGTPRRKAIAVELLYPPHVSINVRGNQLTCVASGYPAPEITWTEPNGRITKGRKHVYVDQSTPTKSSGRYACQAASSISPDATAVLDIEKPDNMLPTILSTTLRYDTSLPLNARDYEMDCSAEVQNFEPVELQDIFYWTKNGDKIYENSRFKTFFNITISSAEKMIVSSTLRIVEVTRSIDGSTFKCRLDLPDKISAGYVRSLERVIRLNVDYPPLPGSISISVHPHPVALEHDDVRLRCTATSMPPSSFRWFYEGRAVSSKPVLQLKNVSRNEAGIYKCVAFNYVPGSVSTRANVVVHFPPDPVVITETEDDLKCSTDSLPPPFYRWLLPNGTVKAGTSVLKLSSLDLTIAELYVCVATNKVSAAKSSYFLRPPKIAGIGALSVKEFIVTVVLVLLAVIVLAVTVFCLVKRRNLRKRRSSIISHKKSLNHSNLLGFVEHSSLGSRASTPPCNVFDDESVSSMKNGDGAVQTRQSVEESGGTSPSKAQSSETLDESGVEIPERCSFESPAKNAKSYVPTTTSCQLASSRLKLSTFSQPDEPDETLRNYFTIRNSGRPKHVTPLTRAFSENFRAGHLGMTEAGRPLVHAIGFGQSNTRKDQPRIHLPPAYSELSSRRNKDSSKCGFSTPVSESMLCNVSKTEQAFSGDDKSTASPMRVSSPNRNEASSRASQITQQKLPTIRNNLGGQDSDLSYASSGYERRDPPIPLRCQSVDPSYPIPSMAELPDRNYLYRACGDRHPTPTSTVLLSNYDSGSDSAKSSNPTNVTYGGRLQSLTLV